MKAWLQFIKYKLSLAVTLTGIVGFLIYSGEADINLLLTGIGIFLLASGSSGLNQYQEHQYDAVMERTKSRPIPKGLISPYHALIVSVLLIVVGAGILLKVNWLPALLGLLNVIFYNALYTPLKRRTYLAILPGALVGAIPPLIGWTAAGGAILSMTIIFLVLLIFMWQIPHFWLLIIKYQKDYEKAGFASVLKLISEIQVRRIVFVWISVSSLYAMTWFLFGITLTRGLSFLLVIANVAFILVFYNMLFRWENEISKAFILSNIFITSIFIILAAGSII
jgi:protoheme IX farnesyltransferase